MSSASQETLSLDDCDFWCDTDGDKIVRGAGNHKTKFVWQVKSFSSRSEQIGEFIESDSFTVISPNDVVTKWKLMLYPNGKKMVKKDGINVKHLTVALCCHETKAIASFIVSISKKRGRKMIKRSQDGRLIDQNSVVGWALPHDQLFGEGIIDDVLIIVVEISVLETFYEIKQKQCLQMMEDLGKAFDEKNSLDVTVNCGDASLECNKFMLTARSPVFKAMFQHDTKENQTNVVNLKDIEPRVLEEMMLYIHTGDAPNVKQLAKELLAVADFYQLNQLKDCCQEVLSETLDAKNSIEILILSDMHSAIKLRKDALKFVSENMNSVSLSCDWEKELACYPSLQSEIIKSLVNIMSKDDTEG